MVGPTEALRVRTGDPATGTSPGGVPVPVSQRRDSGWQLAQRAWQDSGRDWETAPGRPPIPGPRQPDPYARTPHGSGPYAPGAYAPGPYDPDPYGPGADEPDGYRSDPYAAVRANRSYAATPYSPDVFAPDPYALDPYGADEYPADDYPADGYPPGGFAAALAPAPGTYPANWVEPDADADAGEAEPYRPRSRASRLDREDSDATRADFGIPQWQRAAWLGGYPAEPPVPRFYPADPPVYPADQHDAEASDEMRAAGPAASGFRPADAHEAAAYPGGAYADDRYADDQDELANQASALGAGPGRAGEPLDARYAAAPVLEDTRTGVGPWPVQPLTDDPAPHRAAGDRPAPATLRYARQPPPLSRRTWRRGSGWNDETDGEPTGDDRSGHVRRPSASAPPGAAQVPAPPALSEPDELFRAWQGSVREAAGRRTRGSARRPAGQAAGRRRAWQAAKIGVPAVVIVTVGAGALLMLTGRANEMLAERSSTGPARTGQAASTASLILAGYPGGQGGVKVAAMSSASGTVVAVGIADGHPAIWRRAAVNPGWPLVSAAVLGTMSGHLTSIAHGAAGWIAVGSVTSDGTAQPVIYTSADGVTWRTVPSLAAVASSDAQFLGVAAGPGGYLVVGREGTGSQKFAQLWWSPDLANWTAGGSSGYHNSLAIAAVADGDGDGFVAAGSQADCHTIWTSPDGTHWTTHDIPRPAGARTATLRYAAAGTGGRVVAAGFATNDAGGIPIVVTTDAGGDRITQVVLPAGGVPGVVTGVTATGTGFVAAGMIGPAKAQRAVTWTSADGLTWSAATPVSPASGSTITALTSTGGAVTGIVQRGMDPAVQNLSIP